MLARESPAAAEPLRFASGLYGVQGRIAEALETGHGASPLSGIFADDSDAVARHAPSVFRYAAESGPEALAADARARQQDSPSTALSRLAVFWEGGRTAAEDYLSRAILRPYVELLRSANVAPDRSHAPGRCPFCGGPPWISARREGSSLEGARRTLGCSLCGLEWLFERIRCASCFEEDPRKLPSFRDEGHPEVRIEACETCSRYVKSIDLSEDARPIPEVDDLATLAMDLWAAEQGLTRIEPGLAGL